MPFASDNTASLEAHFHHAQRPEERRKRLADPKLLARYQRERLHRLTRSTTLDLELLRHGLNREVLLLKVDVEGHETAVLRGANETMRNGRVHVIILEYGHSTSVAIWDAMKAPKSDAPVAPTPQQMPGNSLFRMQQWADGLGYETFLLGGGAKEPVLLPVTGSWWDDGYEVCRDKRQKFSPDGRTWHNMSAWRPNWSAECWYDVALVHRSSPLFTPLLLQKGALPRSFCRQVARGWYPEWVNQPTPTDLTCENPQLVGKGVCTSFVRAGELSRKG